MNSIISKALADVIINEEKHIEIPIKWINDQNKENYYEFRVPIKIESVPNAKLILKGSTNVTLNRHTFAIIYNGAARIKALDIGKTHKNKCSSHRIEKVGIKHKHTWQDCCKDQWAYVPDDITDNAPLEKTFREFLTECNIKYEDKFPPLPDLQLEMNIDELFNN